MKWLKLALLGASGCYAASVDNGDSINGGVRGQRMQKQEQEDRKLSGMSRFQIPSSSKYGGGGTNIAGVTTPFETVPRDACLTQAQCNARRTQLGVPDSKYFVGSFFDHGCFEKNGKYYWGQGGTVAQRVIDPLGGIKKRVYCPEIVEPTLSPTLAPTLSPEAAPTPTFCNTRIACREQAVKENIPPSNFRAGDFPTKGCFKKNGFAYWGTLGTVEQRQAELTGLKERSGYHDTLYCFRNCTRSSYHPLIPSDPFFSGSLLR